MALTVPFLWFICLSYSIYERNRRDWSCSEQLDATAVFSADLRIPLCDDVRGKSLASESFTAVKVITKHRSPVSIQVERCFFLLPHQDSNLAKHPAQQHETHHLTAI